MRRNYKKSGTGFIALTSAVIIAAVLLIAAVTGGLAGYFGRANILDSELKHRSATAANACADQAFLLIADDPAYTGLSLFTFNSLDSCRVQISGSSPKSVRVQATSSSAVTNLQISYDPSAYSVVSWQEVATY